jgi:hypothetical protein
LDRELALDAPEQRGRRGGDVVRERGRHAEHAPAEPAQAHLVGEAELEDAGGEAPAGARLPRVRLGELGGGQQALVDEGAPELALEPRERALPALVLGEVDLDRSARRHPGSIGPRAPAA